ncbi:alanyl-tRNA editing protein [Pseudosulfitobacter pseudonitzschiae]|uniref:alanyl-tRNA editing protein n=1 Tax=Pseudosulfitobacter pseudonitzschiae TaxID=1402135 RepID=UPI001AFC0451|nr:alanyl-tRNA editing protein [Pseudosulfitobacter pseudonitzschiae]MBM1814727.1 alanyl-tRNA editing protein [Pseudosulfitobacter pseudonitzschiae]MBM1831721.1 alanyl-tRNA editing protein [Pseudosulfitobacter pseudonitzschiae]MBM1836586.1 alanyl-tRNA editing protein [Pseudosulfitobacter pseudonitzschiae]MBM1841433.1 alanyl-tRNA editing protein [Pseudosulfitobacter pseudonitzschiae]MBM1846300.1 alanyl-tRNA editing protein [Pseudosulfitobacter pseudonitzschiae]
MTRMLFREDAYLRDADARVIAHTPEGGVVLDATVFYPTGGGQPGDSGVLEWDGIRMPIATTLKAQGDQIALVPAEPQPLPGIGTYVTQSLDWDRRHRHMRVHTALHLLSVVVPFGVTGGSISANHGRLDFDMPESLENREAIEATLNAYVMEDAQVSEDWITSAELDENPGLIRTMAVKPPRGTGRVRLVRIGDVGDPIDLQPCGGTHVARTGEIGQLRLGRIEKKGRMNRRVYIHLDN